MYDIIVDLDGTLSDSTHRQHHMQAKKKNWMAFYEGMVDDPPNHDILWMVKNFHGAGARIIYCSGRPEEYRIHTTDWLIKHGAPFIGGSLYMRKTGDYRSDYIVKLELLEKMRLDGYDPKIAIDDRDQVVKAWRQVGIRCLQVANGDF
jgi:hypothetical protein